MIEIDTWHAACGKGWHQSGNRTGHCAACHETFQGLATFDWHQSLDERGRVICKDPSSAAGQAKGFRLIDGVWHGPALPAHVLEKMKASSTERVSD